MRNHTDALRVSVSLRTAASAARRSGCIIPARLRPASRRVCCGKENVVRCTTLHPLRAAAPLRVVPRLAPRHRAFASCPPAAAAAAQRTQPRRAPRSCSRRTQRNTRKMDADEGDEETGLLAAPEEEEALHAVAPASPVAPPSPMAAPPSPVPVPTPTRSVAAASPARVAHAAPHAASHGASHKPEVSPACARVHGGGSALTRACGACVQAYGHSSVHSHNGDANGGASAAAPTARRSHDGARRPDAISARRPSHGSGHSHDFVVSHGLTSDGASRAASNSGGSGEGLAADDAPCHF
jgi:hypothetical protein